MAERHGKEAKVQVGTSVIKLTQITLDRSTDKSEVQGFQDTNKRYVLGFRNLQGSFSGVWDDATDNIFDFVDAGIAYPMWIYPSFTNAPTQYHYGLALFDDSWDISVSDAVKFSGSFVATNNWVRMGV